MGKIPKHCIYGGYRHQLRTIKEGVESNFGWLWREMEGREGRGGGGGGQTF